MAWRIDEHVIRGEIDNRTRGRVTGRIWLAGWEEPVELHLEGNAWRDVAGRRLEFVNPAVASPFQGNFAVEQRGVVGDITASRKVKVPEVSMDELMRLYEQRKPFPWHWGNSLYLEWFSERNGRVVIESAGFELIVAPEAAWEMTEAEEAAQRESNGEAMLRFMERAGELHLPATLATDQETDAAPEAESAWSDDERPLTEAEADRMLGDSERLTDRIVARMEREGDAADFDRIIDEEVERRRQERRDPPLTPEQEAERARWIEEMNTAAQDGADDPESMELVRQEHPLAERAQAFACRLAQESEDRDWLVEHSQSEHPIVELVSSASKAAGKLAGALNSREWPPPAEECGLAIAWLKRARGYLNDAIAGADACRDDQLVDAAWLRGVRSEIVEISAEVDELIADLRHRLERGFD